ncbi:MAG: tetratricopeptide repeat protein [Phycisphaerales bacterium]|nr:tetratricopeptide repeat protein [Phycisphaerales bacterium]
MELLREAMQMRSERLGDDHPVTINSMSNLAAIVAKLGRDGEALSLAERALAGRLKSWPAGHPLITSSRVQVAELLMRLGRDGEAESLLLAAWAGAESDPGTSVEIRGKVLRRLVELYELRGQGDRAAEYRGAVERLEKALGGG